MREGGALNSQRFKILKPIVGFLPMHISQELLKSKFKVLVFDEISSTTDAKTRITSISRGQVDSVLKRTCSIPGLRRQPRTI